MDGGRHSLYSFTLKMPVAALRAGEMSASQDARMSAFFIVKES
jgi:hypothetical protein